ncbi:ABC transporter permease [Corynebacterium lubricantis]|uniref:ABC transporter permease n=1 Tax=Corynebacterium lubricantis TaxID=541095 RepID=UPI00036FB18A|nr:ABC transporter permease [Corynebacterium lubricantis]
MENRESAERPVTLVNDKNLIEVSTRPSLPEYIRQLWQRRHFIFAEVHSKAFSTSQDLFLGRLWLVLDPIIQAGFYALVFGIILQVNRGIDNFIGYLIIGLAFFQIITSGLSGGSRLIRNNRSLISSFRFPRASLAISNNLKDVAENSVSLIVAIAIALLFQLDKPISWTIVLVVPLYLLAHLFSLGIMFFSSRAVALVPDLNSLVSLINRGLFFVSGVFFTIERFNFNPTLQSIMVANPIYQFLQAARSVIMLGTVPPFSVWLYLLGWTVITLVLGFIYFWSAESKYDHVK